MTCAPSATPEPPLSRAPGRRATAAFTLVEVMLAACVLALGITTAVLTLQRGFQALDTARHLTAAAQAMQSECERLRLRSWAQLQTLQDSGETAVAMSGVPAGLSDTFACVRTIRDLRSDMKEITVASSWRGYDGREHRVSYVTRYAKSGLYDYFYTAH